MRLAGGEEPGIPAEMRRRLMVERITGEIVENLLLTGSDSPIVHDVQARLDRELGGALTFRYPPGELDMRIYRGKPAASGAAALAEEESGTGPEEIVGEEKARIMDTLWRIAREIVDGTML
jgi:hypothetical protein